VFGQRTRLLPGPSSHGGLHRVYWSRDIVNPAHDARCPISAPVATDAACNGRANLKTARTRPLTPDPEGTCHPSASRPASLIRDTGAASDYVQWSGVDEGMVCSARSHSDHGCLNGRNIRNVYVAPVIRLFNLSRSARPRPQKVHADLRI
jgi:hypothetical protein